MNDLRQRHYTYEVPDTAMGRSYEYSSRRIAEIIDYLSNFGKNVSEVTANCSKGTFHSYIPELLALDERIQMRINEQDRANKKKIEDRDRAELARLISIYGVPT